MNDEWGTPNWPYKQLNAYYKFELDIAATAENKKCEWYLKNAFREQWPTVKSVWCNPPYSSGQLDRWLNLCHARRFDHERICVLLPVDTSTDWFQRYRKRTLMTLFFNKRLAFDGANSSARFASMLFIFGIVELDKEIPALKGLGDLWITG